MQFSETEGVHVPFSELTCQILFQFCVIFCTVWTRRCLLVARPKPPVTLLTALVSALSATDIAAIMYVYQRFPVFSNAYEMLLHKAGALWNGLATSNQNWWGIWSIEMHLFWPDILDTSFALQLCTTALPHSGVTLWPLERCNDKLTSTLQGWPQAYTMQCIMSMTVSKYESALQHFIATKSSCPFPLPSPLDCILRPVRAIILFFPWTWVTKQFVGCCSSFGFSVGMSVDCEAHFPPQSWHY